MTNGEFASFGGTATPSMSNSSTIIEDMTMAATIPMPHPGVVLREEFLEPMGVSVYALAKAIHVTRSRVNEICRGRQAITANIALRLGRFFGVDPQWFMNMQAKYDLHVQAQKLSEELARIAPRSAA
jgi:addiction module HigA family antidote